MPTPSPRLVSVVIPVYRDGSRAANLTERLHLQRMPPGTTCEVVLVDDGSGDGKADLLKAIASSTTRVIILASNHGRAIARNTGAAAARGEYIFFIDSDCLPAGPDVISAHVAALRNGSVASIGPVLGKEDTFWGRYQFEASTRRAKQHAKGITYGGSSQNLMVSRKAFLEVGGFDPAYRNYGFEDRDLQVRLLALGCIEWTPQASVQHVDEIHLRSVSRKMMEAGQTSAGLFSVTHPDAYRALGYAALDAALHQWLRPLAHLSRALAGTLSTIGDKILERREIPYFARRAYARAVSALSFLAGTSLRGERAGNRSRHF